MAECNPYAWFGLGMSSIAMLMVIVFWVVGWLRRG